MYLSYDVIILLLYLTAIVVGYIVGKTENVQVYYNNTGECASQPKKSFRKHQEETEVIQQIKSVNIDDTIFVQSIDTSGMEKKFDNISTTTEQPAQIEQSINKLSQIMKRRQ